MIRALMCHVGIMTKKKKCALLIMLRLFLEQKIIEHSLTNLAHNTSNTNLTAESQKLPPESYAQIKSCLATNHDNTSSTLSTISDADESNSSNHLIHTKCTSLHSHSHSTDDNIHDTSNFSVSMSINSHSDESITCSVTNDDISQNSHPFVAEHQTAENVNSQKNLQKLNCQLENCDKNFHISPPVYCDKNYPIPPSISEVESDEKSFHDLSQLSEKTLEAITYLRIRIKLTAVASTEQAPPHDVNLTQQRGAMGESSELPQTECSSGSSKHAMLTSAVVQHSILPVSPRDLEQREGDASEPQVVGNAVASQNLSLSSGWSDIAAGLTIPSSALHIGGRNQNSQKPAQNVHPETAPDGNAQRTTPRDNVLCQTILQCIGQQDNTAEGNFENTLVQLPQPNMAVATTDKPAGQRQIQDNAVSSSQHVPFERATTNKNKNAQSSSLISSFTSEEIRHVLHEEKAVVDECPILCHVDSRTGNSTYEPAKDRTEGNVDLVTIQNCVCMEAAIAWDKQHQISHGDNFNKNLITSVDSVSMIFSHWVWGSFVENMLTYYKYTYSSL